jgi:hypothetical protein
MHSWSEAGGDVLEELGLGLGLGLGLVLVGLGLGLGEVVVGVGVGVAEALEGALAVGVGVALAETLADALAVGVGVALALLTDTAVSWAAHGFVAASAGVVLLISKIPVSAAGMTRIPEITPNARVVARRLLMDTPSPPWSSRPGRVRCHGAHVNAGSIPR